MWYVYMVRCNDGSLYTGVTTDVVRRVAEHNDPKKGAKYTKARQPVELVYSISAADRSAAQVEEARLKRLSRVEKLALFS